MVQLSDRLHIETSTDKEHSQKIAVEFHSHKIGLQEDDFSIAASSQTRHVPLRYAIIATLILYLRLSVAQVKSANERRTGLLNYSERKTRSESVISNNQTKFDYLDSNARSWVTFDSWEINEPLVIDYGKVAYSVLSGNRKKQHLIVSGGFPYSSYKYKETRQFGSWLYTMDTNSWQRVDTDDFRLLSRKPQMVQLCSNIIVLGPSITSGLTSSSKAWIFDTLLLMWQPTQIYGSVPGWVNLNIQKNHIPIAVGLDIYYPQSKCKCKRSALFFLRHDNAEETYEVRCVRRNGVERYEWFSFSSSTSPFLVTEHTMKLAASSSISTFLYIPYTRILWKFENRTWTQQGKSNYSLQSFQGEFTLRTFGCVLISETSSYIVFSIREKKVLKFDLKLNKFIIEYVLGEIPEDWYVEVVAAVAETQNMIAVFIIDIHIGKTSVWKFIYENRVWIWRKWQASDIAPLSRMASTYAVKGHYLMVAGAISDSGYIKSSKDSYSHFIWKLDLESKQWWLESKETKPDLFVYEESCWVGSCCFVPLRNNISKGSMEAWIYNTSDNSWNLLTSTPWLYNREFMSFVSFNSTNAIIFGGKVLYTYFNETWILQMHPSSQWKQLSKNSIHSIRPSARYKHAAVMMQSKMYVFGGINAFEQCLNDLWVFDVNREIWSEVTSVNEKPDLTNACYCTYSAASTPGQLLITVVFAQTMDGFDGIISDCTGVIIKTFMFIVHLKMWHIIATPTRNDDFDSTNVDSLLKTFYWKGFLVMFDPMKVDLKYLVVRCPAGFASYNISNHPCDYCRKGHYRETIFSDPNCIQCPNGLTTVNNGARSIKECTVCEVNRCKYGKCVADLSERSLQPVCRCNFGFTGSTCEIPTYYLIGTGLILASAFVSAGVTAYVVLLKRKKIKERALRRQVDELTDVWQIEEDEVTSQERVGSGASGAVYKAYYRNIVVAVKKMIAVGLPKSTEDFESEIMFMRTVRHKNIVLFIGAGKSQPEDVPFLVMEYMERGSLKNVLYDSSIAIDYDRKLSFALDAARGMHFLHTLEPPRIHRDLKSDNLLVSKDWIVKVADFGLGRAVTNEFARNHLQIVKQKNSSDSHRIPLLPLRKALSFAGVGTARWRAPELTLRKLYDTAVDVYSFGIVLWEIWTRQLPFDQYSFDYEVTDAVIANERPVIPRDCPQPLAIIMKQCWLPKPSDRLTFGQVISKLQFADKV